ncbi:glycosyltransferase [Agriterribacter sp.]|uniref:glycosyltransferase family 4 protein n=1 Tax=Agriterribacter sp. TaxID=2821509 RepID=UPI002BB5BF06|nr:glycosyltransferase [Agriterribacter sp.]HRP57665.1 glycosyltransferase [Agriterribacter sp.]
MNILVLYTRFSAYINASFSHYAELHHSNVHVVKYATDKNSPFQLKKSVYLSFYNRDEIDMKALISLIQQNDIKVVISAGWADKLYMKAAKWAHANNLLTICIADNQWMGTLKQRLLTFISPWVLKTRFDKMWIPGVYQFEYARRLGFARYNIMLRYYTADTNLFISHAKTNVPKRFIYVGRLLEIKGIEVLHKALNAMIPYLKKNNWSFLIVGNGNKREEFEQMALAHDCIEYYAFLQPHELAAKTADGGVFVLPSNYDAWGVVVHEYALLGSPLLLSEAVGSRSAFLIDGFNGKVFVSGSSASLQQQCIAFMDTTPDNLNEMGKRSQALASGYSLDIWAATLKNSIDDYFSGVKHNPLKRTKYQ